MKPEARARLQDLVDSLESLDRELTIFIKRGASLGPDTPAVAVAQGASSTRGMLYLLEVDIALEAIEVWSAWRGGRQPSSEERLAAVIHYATHEAYLPI